MRFLRLMSVFLLLIATCVSARDWTAQEYTMDPGDLGTPTTRWLGEDYAGGDISVLILKGDQLGYRQNTRQPMELVRAFPFMDAEYSLYGYHMSDNERTLELLESRDWDVIVSWEHWRAPWPKLSGEAKYRVLASVADGTGLIFTRRAPGSVLRDDRKTEVPATTLAGGLGLSGRAGRDESYFHYMPREESALKNKWVSTYRIGRGRALRFARFKKDGNSGAKLFTWNHRIDHQYMMAEMGRAILWAAGREPEVRFVSAPPALWKLDWGTSEGQESRWVLEIGGEKRDITLRWRIRDLTGRIHHRDRKRFAGATGRLECAVTLPDLGAGRYYLDVFAESPRGGENYGYSGIEVAPPWAVEIERKQQGVEVGSPLEGTATVSLTEDAPDAVPDGRLVLSLIDIHDRIVDRASRPLSPDRPVPFSFPTQPNYPIEMRVEARVVAAGRPAGSASTAYHLLKRRHDRFNVVLWGTWTGPYQHWGKRKMWETGVTSFLGRNTEGANINSTPTNFAYNWPVGDARLRFPRLKKDPELGVPVMHPACWNDEEPFGEMLAAKDGVFQRGTRTPVFVYNMYDEGPHSGLCLHPECLEAYRGWLKEQYDGDLAWLNREWESGYDSWAEVNVWKTGDNREKAARKEGLYARWSDRKHFGEVNFCRRMVGGLARRARRHDPKARVGFEGSGGFGMDFDELIENSGFWCPYDGLRTEVVRSLKPDDFIHSYWIGYNKRADMLIARGWRAIINDAPGIWWWMLAGRGRFHGWLAPNNEPYPENRRFLDEVILPLRQGLGDLLMGLEPQHDGIALYYSVAATHAGELGDSADFNSVPGAHGSVLRLIEDCGYQWVYTTKKRVLQGDLEQRGIRLLILPFIQTLGEKEVTALRGFVQDGGTVVADLRPGVYSGHCRPLEQGPADSLFGIRRSGPGKAVRTDGELTAEVAGKEIPLSISNNRSDSQIEPADSEAAGTQNGCPLFLVNRIGDGRTILLNFHLTQYAGHREMDEGREQRDFFRALAGALDLRPRIERSNADGEELLRTETATWSLGDISVYGLYRDGAGETAATIRLPETRHVFDLRDGPRGRTGEIGIEKLKPGYAQFLATYPYDPRTPRVTPAAKTVTGAENVRFDIILPGVPAEEEGIFSFHTRLLGPDDEWVDVIPWSVQGRAGRAEVNVRFAHNDPAGEWTLWVREITTGRVGRGRVVKK